MISERGLSVVGGTAKASSEGKVSDVSQKSPVTVGQVNKSICKGGKKMDSRLRDLVSWL